MATSVIMPALELAQETGKVIRWLKVPGDAVAKGEPLLEIETDKVTTEIEAPASGILMNVSAQEGDVIPVGQAIAQIGAPGEAGAAAPAGSPPRAAGVSPAAAIKASPLARKIAEQHGVDLVQVKTSTGRIEKADVLAYVEARTAAAAAPAGPENTAGQVTGAPSRAAVRLNAASPKARRLLSHWSFRPRPCDRPTARPWAPCGASWPSG